MQRLVIAILLLMQADKAQVIQGTAGSRATNFEIHTGGLVVREGEAGAAFGTIQIGKAREQLSYFVLLKHSLSASNALEWSEETTAEDTIGSSKQTLALEGKSLQMDYEVRLAAKSARISRESMTINQKSVDLARGRLILVDMTANPPRWEQRKVDLPTEVTATTSKKAAEDLVRKVLASTTKQDRKVKEFVDAARK
jgi:hypothetical protein